MSEPEHARASFRIGQWEGGNVYEWAVCAGRGGGGVGVAKLSSSANTFGFQSCAVFPWSTTHLFHVTILNFLQK